MKVSVSILSQKEKYNEVLKKLNNTKCDFIHLDVLDNTFVDQESFSYNDFKNINFEKKLDIHLMSNDLDNQIDNFSKLNPEYITIHEEVKETIKYINKIKNKNIKVGLALNPETDIENIYPYLELVDLILVMSVKPGKGGQKFMPEVIGKLQELKEIQDRYNYVIEVDGGINKETIKYVENYADIVVSGSFIVNSDDYEEKISELKSGI